MRREVLESVAYPEVRYESADVAVNTVAQGRYQVQMMGRLSLHGVTRPKQVEATLLVSEVVRLRGGRSLRLSDFRIRPVTALGGAIKLQDELEVKFDIVGLPEET
jgi:polyisoprenoid-binding protein YceI